MENLIVVTAREIKKAISERGAIDHRIAGAACVLGTLLQSRAPLDAESFRELADLVTAATQLEAEDVRLKAAILAFTPVYALPV